jgi:outer membrane protein assembly complex protein YaeT
MRRPLSSNAFPLWCVLLLFAVLGAARAQDFRGKTVVAVEYEPVEQPLYTKDLQNMQQVRAGEPLDLNQVAASIDTLYASGLYDDIRVDAEPSANGVIIRFITKPRRFLGHVGVEGKISDPPSRATIISDSQLVLGTPFDEQTLEAARQTIEQEMRQNGLYESTVGVSTIEDPLTHQMTVQFLVNAGRRARYETPVIRGDTKLPDETIIKATGWRWPLIHKWRQVTSALTDKGTDGIRKAYAKRDRLTASITLTSLDYDRQTGRAKPSFDIDAGPKIEIKALEAKVSKRKLRQFVPVYQEGTVDRDLLTEGAENLHDYFQSKGYPDVQVDFRREPPKDDQELIEYTIATGPRRRLVNISIQGNSYFTDESLRERMFLRTSRFLMRYGRYSESFRKSDQESIANLYRENGFQDVSVTSTVQTDYKGKPQDIAVTFHIDPGKQWTVANLYIEGATRLDLSPIRNELASIQGQPYAAVNVATDRNRIIEYYYSNGFPKASFSYRTTPGPEPQTINLTYRINEGPREFVRQVIISGLYRTRPSLVLRDIDIKEGEPISMLKINNISRQLTNLGIFANVETGIQDANGTNQYKYVLYDFDEAARYSFNVGFGLELGQFGHTTNNLSAAGGVKGVSPIISFDVNRVNFRGIGQTLSLQTRYSTLEQRASINYIVPRFLGSLNRTVTFSLLYDTTQDVQTFSARREEASVQTSQRFNRASTLLLRFAYRRVSTSNIQIPSLLLPLYSQPVRIGILSGSYIQDHRDNPTDAHRGFWNTLDAGVAGKFFGSQRSFLRVLARNATYTPIGRNLVLARQTQIGEILPFNIPAGTQGFDAIPLPERFFGGGSLSMRGFGDNQAGPRDIGTPTQLPAPPTSTPTGFPIGGNALFFNNVELRFPILGPNITGVLFEDMGNIYTGFGDISFAYRQPSAVTYPGHPGIAYYQNFNYAVQAPGFGIRYKTPVGPVRLDFAYALNPPRYLGFNRNEPIQDLFPCGNIPPGQLPPPQCIPTPQQLSHFQFSFSIGQAF